MEDSINSRFKRAREARKMTMKQVAELVCIKDSSIAMIETGKNNPSARTIKLFCSTMRINETWLRTGEGEMELEEDLLTQLRHKYGLSAESGAIIEEFVSLPAAAQEIVVQYVQSVAERINRLHDAELADAESEAERFVKKNSPEQSGEPGHAVDQ